MPSHADQSLPSNIEFLSQVARFWKAKDGATVRPAQLGRFIIQQCLGNGGFGIVYRAWDPLLNRDIALKVPGVQSLLDESRLQRFLREARHLGSISHPNVAEVFEASEVDGLCYIAMKYYPDGTLAAWLRTQKSPIPVPIAWSIFVEIVRGVAAAHSVGLIHRDLKPSNILLERSSPDALVSTGPSTFGAVRPIVADFGLVKDLNGNAEPTLTLDNARIGTFGYMAPEQLNGKPSDITAAADVYSLGVLLSELLTGHGPTCMAGSDERYATGSAVTECCPPPANTLDVVPLRAVSATIPDALVHIRDRCLRLTPFERFPDAMALLEAIQGLNIEAEMKTISSRDTARRTRRSSKWFAWLAASASVFVLFGLWASTVLRMAPKPEQRWTGTAEPAPGPAPGAGPGNVRDYAARIQALFRSRSLDSQHTFHRKIAEAVSPLGDSSSLPFETRYLLASLGRDFTIFRPPAKSHHVFWTQFSPDHRCVALTGDKNDIVLCELETNRVLRRFQGLRFSAYRFAFSPDQKTIVGVSVPPLEHDLDELCSVLFWDVESGAVLMRLDEELRLARVISCEFVSADEVQISGFAGAGYKDYRVSLSQRMVTTKRNIELGSPDCPVHEPEDELLIDSPSIRLRKRWNAVSNCWQLVHRDKLAGRDATVELLGNVHAFSWNATGQVAFVDSLHSPGVGAETRPALADMRFVIWDPGADQQKVLLKVRDGLDTTSLALSDDGESMVYSDVEGTVRYRDVSSRGVRVSNGAHVPNEVWSVAVHPDGKSILSGADAGWVGRGSIDGDPMDLATLHGDQLVTGVSWRPNSSREFASSSFDQTLRLWAANPQGPPKQLVSWEHPHRVRCLAFSPDGRFVASGCDDHVVRIWDCTTHALLASLKGHTDKIRSLTFSIDGVSLFSTSNDASVRRWRVLDGAVMETEFAASNPICCAVSPDGEKMAYGTQGGVLSIRSLRDPADRMDLPVSSEWLQSLAISHDSRTLATGSADGTIRLWNLATGLFLTDLASESSAIMSLSFSSDDSTLVAGLYSGEILTWRCAREE